MTTFRVLTVAGAMVVGSLLTAAPPAAANGCTFSSHTGDAADPYPISSEADLECLQANDIYWGGSFVQTTDLNMDGRTAWTQGIGSTDGNPFTGTYDGRGHTIADLTVTLASTVRGGLFGAVTGVVSNLHVSGSVNSASSRTGGLVGFLKGGTVTNSSADVAVTSSGNNAGGLIGFANSDATVTGSHALGPVTSTRDTGFISTGGLIGYGDDVTVADCYATGTVTGGNTASSSFSVTAGGLVGNLWAGTVRDSYSTGRVTAGVVNLSAAIGGLVGWVGAGTSIGRVQDSYSTGDVSVTVTAWAFGEATLVGGLAGAVEPNSSVVSSSASGAVTGAPATSVSESTPSVGGLVGLNRGIVTTSSATGNVFSGGREAGGLVGFNEPGGAISESFAMGDVSGTGTERIGGLAGENRGSIESSYATGSVSGTSTRSGDIGFGGLVGRNNTGGTISDSYAVGAMISVPSIHGGLVGANGGTLAASPTSFFDTQTTGASSGVGSNTGTGDADGRSTAQMRDRITFLDGSWAIAAGWDAGTTWGICSSVNAGYPFLATFYETNPCSGPAAAVEFTYWLPGERGERGVECTNISPQRVSLGSQVALPGADADCRERDGSLIGWTIPGQDYAFEPGRVVPVTDAQQFTAVPVYDWVRVVFDANVGAETACLHEGEDTAVRTGAWWVPRNVLDDQPLPATAACVPPGHALIGWTDRRGTEPVILELPGTLPEVGLDNSGHPANDLTLYAVWVAAPVG